MMLMMSYEVAQKMDNNVNNTLLIWFVIIGFIGIIATLLVLIDERFFIITIISIISIFSIAFYGALRTNYTTITAHEIQKEQLPSKQYELENLRAKRLELIHQGKNKIEINQLNKQIAKLQTTVNHYNYIVNQNN